MKQKYSKLYRTEEIYSWRHIGRNLYGGETLILKRDTAIRDLSPPYDVEEREVHRVRRPQWFLHKKRETMDEGALMEGVYF